MGSFLSFIIITVVSTFWGGYVSSVLWNWLLTPLGMPSITFLQAVGIACVLSSFLGERGLYIEQKDSELEQFFTDLTMATILPLFTLIIGFFVK